MNINFISTSNNNSYRSYPSTQSSPNDLQQQTISTRTKQSTTYQEFFNHLIKASICSESGEALIHFNSQQPFDLSDPLQSKKMDQILNTPIQFTTKLTILSTGIFIKPIEVEFTLRELFEFLLSLKNKDGSPYILDISLIGSHLDELFGDALFRNAVNHLPPNLIPNQLILDWLDQILQHKEKAFLSDIDIRVILKSNTFIHVGDRVIEEDLSEYFFKQTISFIAKKVKNFNEHDYKTLFSDLKVLSNTGNITQETLVEYILINCEGFNKVSTISDTQDQFQVLGLKHTTPIDLIFVAYSRNQLGIAHKNTSSSNSLTCSIAKYLKNSESIVFECAPYAPEKVFIDYLAGISTIHTSTHHSWCRFLREQKRFTQKGLEEVILNDLLNHKTDFYSKKTIKNYRTAFQNTLLETNVTFLKQILSLEIAKKNNDITYAFKMLLKGSISLDNYKRLNSQEISQLWNEFSVFWNQEELDSLSKVISKKIINNEIPFNIIKSVLNLLGVVHFNRHFTTHQDQPAIQITRPYRLLLTFDLEKDLNNVFIYLLKKGNVEKLEDVINEASKVMFSALEELQPIPEITYNDQIHSLIHEFLKLNHPLISHFILKLIFRLPPENISKNLWPQIFLSIPQILATMDPVQKDPFYTQLVSASALHFSSLHDQLKNYTVNQLGKSFDSITRSWISLLAISNDPALVFCSYQLWEKIKNKEINFSIKFFETITKTDPAYGHRCLKIIHSKNLFSELSEKRFIELLNTLIKCYISKGDPSLLHEFRSYADEWISYLEKYLENESFDLDLAITLFQQLSSDSILSTDQQNQSLKKMMIRYLKNDIPPLPHSFEINTFIEKLLNEPENISLFWDQLSKQPPIYREDKMCQILDISQKKMGTYPSPQLEAKFIEYNHHWMTHQAFQIHYHKAYPKFIHQLFSYLSSVITSVETTHSPDLYWKELELIYPHLEHTDYSVYSLLIFQVLTHVSYCSKATQEKIFAFIKFLQLHILESKDRLDIKTSLYEEILNSLITSKNYGEALNFFGLLEKNSIFSTKINSLQWNLYLKLIDNEPQVIPIVPFISLFSRIKDQIQDSDISVLSKFINHFMILNYSYEMNPLFFHLLNFKNPEADEVVIRATKEILGAHHSHLTQAISDILFFSTHPENTSIFINLLIHLIESRFNTLTILEYEELFLNETLLQFPEAYQVLNKWGNKKLSLLLEPNSKLPPPMMLILKILSIHPTTDPHLWVLLWNKFKNIKIKPATLTQLVSLFEQKDIYLASAERSSTWISALQCLEFNEHPLLESLLTKIMSFHAIFQNDEELVLMRLQLARQLKELSKNLSERKLIDKLFEMRTLFTFNPFERDCFLLEKASQLPNEELHRKLMNLDGFTYERASQLNQTERWMTLHKNLVISYLQKRDTNQSIGHELYEKIVIFFDHFSYKCRSKTITNTDVQLFAPFFNFLWNRSELIQKNLDWLHQLALSPNHGLITSIKEELISFLLDQIVTATGQKLLSMESIVKYVANDSSLTPQEQATLSGQFFSQLCSKLLENPLLLAFNIDVLPKYSYWVPYFFSDSVRLRTDILPKMFLFIPKMVKSQFISNHLTSAHTEIIFAFVDVQKHIQEKQIEKLYDTQHRAAFFGWIIDEALLTGIPSSELHKIFTHYIHSLIHKYASILTITKFIEQLIFRHPFISSLNPLHPNEIEIKEQGACNDQLITDAFNRARAQNNIESIFPLLILQNPMSLSNETHSIKFSKLLYSQETILIHENKKVEICSNLLKTMFEIANTKVEGTLRNSPLPVLSKAHLLMLHTKNTRDPQLASDDYFFDYLKLFTHYSSQAIEHNTLLGTLVSLNACFHISKDKFSDEMVNLFTLRSQLLQSVIIQILNESSERDVELRYYYSYLYLNLTNQIINSKKPDKNHFSFYIKILKQISPFVDFLMKLPAETIVKNSLCCPTKVIFGKLFLDNLNFILTIYPYAPTPTELKELKALFNMWCHSIIDRLKFDNSSDKTPLDPLIDLTLDYLIGSRLLTMSNHIDTLLFHYIYYLMIQKVDPLGKVSLSFFKMRFESDISFNTYHLDLPIFEDLWQRFFTSFTQVKNINNNSEEITDLTLMDLKSCQTPFAEKVIEKLTFFYASHKDPYTEALHRLTTMAETLKSPLLNQPATRPVFGTIYLLLLEKIYEYKSYCLSHSKKNEIDWDHHFKILGLCEEVSAPARLLSLINSYSSVRKGNDNEVNIFIERVMSLMPDLKKYVIKTGLFSYSFSLVQLMNILYKEPLFKSLIPPLFLLWHKILSSENTLDNQTTLSTHCKELQGLFLQGEEFKL